MGFVFQFVSNPSDGRPGQHHRRWAVSLASAVAAVLALLASGCGSSAGSGGGHGGGGGHRDKVDVDVLPSKPSKPMTVQQLAADMGCGDAPADKFKDYRMVRCDLDQQSFILVDFDTDNGLEIWLDHSTDYGGFYLVGPNWVVSGNALAEISPLQDKFGGKIEEGENHGDPPPSSRPPTS
jgi:hypothetical protein